MTNLIQDLHSKLDNAVSQLWFNLESITEIPVSDEIINRIIQLYKQREMEFELGLSINPPRITFDNITMHTMAGIFNADDDEYVLDNRLLYDDVLFNHFNIHVYYLPQQDMNEIIALINKQSQLEFGEDVLFLRLCYKDEIYFIADYKGDCYQSCRIIQHNTRSARLNLFNTDVNSNAITFILRQLYEINGIV